MSVERSWMWRRFDKNGCITPEFEKGVIEFLDFAYMQHTIVHHDQIRCPCSKCCNKQYLTRNEVHFHLKKNGFERGYTLWLAHGESYRSTASTAQGETVNEESSRRDGGIGMRSMVFDAAGPNFDWNFNEDEHFGSNYQEPNPDAQRFYKLLNDADEPLWNGCLYICGTHLCYSRWMNGNINPTTKII